LGVDQSVSEVDDEVTKRTKNAQALHIIQISCGREIVDEISHFTTAKKAWNHLSTQYGQDHLKSADGGAAQGTYLHKLLLIYMHMVRYIYGAWYTKKNLEISTSYEKVIALYIDVCSYFF
jgi:hypothetical protein